MTTLGYKLFKYILLNGTNEQKECIRFILESERIKRNLFLNKSCAFYKIK